MGHSVRCHILDLEASIRGSRDERDASVLDDGNLESIRGGLRLVLMDHPDPDLSVPGRIQGDLRDNLFEKSVDLRYECVHLIRKSGHV